MAQTGKKAVSVAVTNELEAFKAEAQAAMDGRLSNGRVVPEVTDKVENGYVVLSVTSPRKGTKFLGVFRIGDPSKVRGFASPVFRVVDDDVTDEILGYNLQLSSTIDGRLEEGKELVTPKTGYKFIARKRISESNVVYWALVNEEGKFCGYADQVLSQIKMTYKVTVAKI